VFEREVDCWIGGCVRQFTNAEGSVARALIALGEAEQFKPFNAQRIASLRERLKAIEESHGHVKAALSAIDAYEFYRPFRDIICHGTVTITITRRTGWLAIFENYTSVNGRTEIAVLNVRQDRANPMLVEIGKACRTLSSSLGQIGKAK